MIHTKLIPKILLNNDVKYGDLTDSQMSVSTDTRTLNTKSMFICLKGESFDGFQFADEIVKKDTPVIVYEKSEESNQKAKDLSTLHPDKCFIGVKSTLDFLQALAKEHRDQWIDKNKKREIIGLTGSNGKTTTKEMLRLLLSSFLGEKLTYTKGNYNNHIGVPLTLLELQENHEVIIVEMGTNHHGEIGALCEIARPTSGLITNIGTGHIEYFKTQQEIYKEKKALFESIHSGSEGRVFVVNTDDEFLKNLSGMEKTVSCGEKAAHFQTHCDHQHLEFSIAGEFFDIRNQNIFGKHNYQDLALALSLSISLYPEKKDMLIETARTLALPDNNRSVWKQVNGSKLFLDAYNANPHSMRASLEAFVTRMNDEKISLDDVLFVLGDMNELGDLSHEFHREIGSYLASIGAKNVFFIGRYSKSYNEGYENQGQIFGDKQSAKQALVVQGKKYGAYFLKASRSLQLESMTDIF